MSTAQSVLETYQKSAFGLVRTGAPYLQVDITNTYQLDTAIWGKLETGSGVGGVTHVAAQSALSVKAGGAAGVAKIETHEYWRYQAGKGTRWLMTGYSTAAGVATNVREWGQFNDDNGIFFRHARATAGNQLDIVVRSKVSGVVVDTPIAQNTWNRDKLDGSGGATNPSGVTLNPLFGNIYEVTYQWLGVGAIQFWINGILVHVRENANLIAAPYMTTAHLPMRVLVTDTGSGASSGWVSICTAAYIEGGDDPALWGFAYDVPGAPFALATAETPLLSLRPANTINSIANRSFIIPNHLSVACGNFSSASATVTFKMYLNSVLTTGLAWTAIGSPSYAERDIGTTAAGFAAGTLVLVLTLGEFDQVTHDLSTLFNIHARKLIRRDLATITQDLITITAQLSTGTGTGQCHLGWNETH